MYLTREKVRLQCNKNPSKYASRNWLTVVRRQRRSGGLITRYNFKHNGIYIRLLR